jgi:hypothetical protein
MKTGNTDTQRRGERVLRDLAAQERNWMVKKNAWIEPSRHPGPDQRRSKQDQKNKDSPDLIKTSKNAQESSTKIK